MTKMLRSLVIFSFILVLGYTNGCAKQQQLSWDTLKSQIRDEFPEVEHISIAEFERNRLETPLEKLLVVDVRDREEFAVSHLQDAVNLQDEDAILDLAQQQNIEQIILYCSVGYRSAKMAQNLADRGWDDAVNLEGSIFEWANSGHPVFVGDKEVEVVHPFDRFWGQLLDRDYHPK